MTKRIQQLPATSAQGLKIVAVEDAAGGVTSNVTLQEIADLAPTSDSQLLQRVRFPIVANNSTTSDSYVNTSISASITPLQASSRLELTVNLTAESSATGGPPYRANTRRKSSPNRCRNPSSSRPSSRLALDQNSCDAPHQAGTRSGSSWANAVSTRSREFITTFRMAGVR